LPPTLITDGSANSTIQHEETEDSMTETTTSVPAREQSTLATTHGRLFSVNQNSSKYGSIPYNENRKVSAEQKENHYKRVLNKLQ